MYTGRTRDKTTADPIQRVSGEFGGRIDAKRWCDVPSRKPDERRWESVELVSLMMEYELN
jgi:hypothetical protein